MTMIARGGTTTTTSPAAAPTVQPGQAEAAVTHSSSCCCPRCQRDDVGKLTSAHPICTRCVGELSQEAQRLQERDHLARWLSTRWDEWPLPRLVRRRIALAEQLGVDYRHPPEPRVFAVRLADLFAPYRPPKAEGDHAHGRTTSTTTP